MEKRPIEFEGTVRDVVLEDNLAAVRTHRNRIVIIQHVIVLHQHIGRHVGIRCHIRHTGWQPQLHHRLAEPRYDFVTRVRQHVDLTNIQTARRTGCRHNV